MSDPPESSSRPSTSLLIRLPPDEGEDEVEHPIRFPTPENPWIEPSLATTSGHDTNIRFDSGILNEFDPLSSTGAGSLAQTLAIREALPKSHTLSLDPDALRNPFADLQLSARTPGSSVLRDEGKDGLVAQQEESLRRGEAGKDGEGSEAPAANLPVTKPTDNLPHSRSPSLTLQSLIPSILRRAPASPGGTESGDRHEIAVPDHVGSPVSTPSPLKSSAASDKRTKTEPEPEPLSEKSELDEKSAPSTSAADPEKSLPKTSTPPPPPLPPKPPAQSSTFDTAPPFDFNLFITQLRSRPAEPIGKYFRSFLKEFAKQRGAPVGGAGSAPGRGGGQAGRTANAGRMGTKEQVRVVNDFLDFISVKMRMCEVWANASEAEFENAVEAMEKLTMNRIWHLTFTPALPPYLLPSPTDDLERDHVLSQRIKLFGWIEEKHLDIDLGPLDEVEENAEGVAKEGGSSEESVHPDGTRKRKSRARVKAEGFVDYAKGELSKVNHYKAPRDKLICILNSCKVIFGLMRYLSLAEGADSFMPFLIYVVLKANPEHLVSNIQYIQRFRNPEKLQGEGGYYLSSLNAAISFIETMSEHSLSNITQEEFESNVEEAILNLPPEPPSATATSQTPPPDPSRSRPAHPTRDSSVAGPLSEGADAESPQILTHSAQAGLSSVPNSGSSSPFPDAALAFLQKSTDLAQRTVSKPLNAIGKIFSEMGSDENLPATPSSSSTASTPPPVRRRGFPTVTPTPGEDRSSYFPSGNYNPNYVRPPPGTDNPSSSRRPRQNSADYMPDSVDDEAAQAEIEFQHQKRQEAAVGTLKTIFPQVDNEVLEVVLVANRGDLGKTIEGLLEMTAEG